MGELPVPGQGRGTPRTPRGEDEGVSHESNEHHIRKLGLGYWAGNQPRELFAQQGYAATEGTAGADVEGAGERSPRVGGSKLRRRR